MHPFVPLLKVLAVFRGFVRRINGQLGIVKDIQLAKKDQRNPKAKSNPFLRCQIVRSSQFSCHAQHLQTPNFKCWGLKIKSERIWKLISHADFGETKVHCQAI